MKILNSIKDFKDPREPLVLTIGNFDGMHRGHGALIKKVKELAGSNGQSVALTFRNHPSEILRPDSPVPLLCTLEHKLMLLQNSPLDYIILMTFTPYLAQHYAASFIENIRQSIPFSHLVLGHDATLGRDKQGNRAVMQELGDQWGFTTFYVDEYRFEGKAVSSSRIREALRQGDLSEVEALLNRPYSIYAPIMPSEKDGGGIVRLDVSGLCLPPPGSYQIEALIHADSLEGMAVIKACPKIGNSEENLLEVHLQDKNQNLDIPAIEIIFRGSCKTDFEGQLL